MLRAALDHLEGLHGGLLQRIARLDPAPPLPVAPALAPAQAPARPTHAISETAA
jgi:hypothetical protein